MPVGMNFVSCPVCGELVPMGPWDIAWCLCRAVFSATERNVASTDGDVTVAIRSQETVHPSVTEDPPDACTDHDLRRMANGWIGCASCLRLRAGMDWRFYGRDVFEEYLQRCPPAT